MLLIKTCESVRIFPGNKIVAIVVARLICKAPAPRSPRFRQLFTATDLSAGPARSGEFLSHEMSEFRAPVNIEVSPGVAGGLIASRAGGSSYSLRWLAESEILNRSTIHSGTVGQESLRNPRMRQMRRPARTPVQTTCRLVRP